MAYRPSIPFTVAMILLEPTYTTVNAVKKKTYPSILAGQMFYGNFRTFGGTERNVNGVYSIEDTANIETWYNPDIKANCRVVVADSLDVYEIIGEPENVEMRNQFTLFKVQRVKGGA